jgi:intracellular multiplication protein IcmK
MKLIKGKIMQKKVMVIIMGALFGAQAFAQEIPKNSDPSQKIVIKQESMGAVLTPPQAANPYGSVQDKGSQQINYNNVGNNIKGRQILIPSNVSAAAINDSNVIPNPAQAQAQMGVPTQAPNGLPQNYEQDTYHRSGNMDPVDATMNILNTPDGRIREINRDLYGKGRVLNETPVTPPKSINGVLTASLAPGSTPPVIRLSKNRTTAIIITDVNGQPWPIVNYDGLSTDDFIVKRLDAPSPDGYVLSVTPKGSFVAGNLALILKGLVSPISIDFVSAQKEVDVKTEIRIQAQGPNTQYVSIGLPDGIDTALLSVLQGVPPKDAKELRVSSNAVQAWLAKDGKMYVRTRYKVMSPAFENVSSSPDGTYAYKMVPVPVVLYKAEEGKFGEFNISGF